MLCATSRKQALLLVLYTEFYNTSQKINGKFKHGNTSIKSRHVSRLNHMTFSKSV